MANKEEEQGASEGQTTAELSAEEEVKQKPIEAEEAIKKNPDVEDPRLFSPLQEPDRPSPQERVSEEKRGSENHAG